MPTGRDRYAQAVRSVPMRAHYDFSQSKPNPYVGKLKKPVTIRLGVDVIDYFRAMSEETGIPYQTLINL